MSHPEIDEKLVACGKVKPCCNKIIISAFIT